MSEKLSLVIPCYNEEKTLRALVEKVLKLREQAVDLELVIVDDCSKDNSLALAQTLSKEYPQIKVVHHEVNRGKGAALRSGFLEASGDYVGIQDADMEYEPSDYLVLLRAMREENAQIVYGSRYLRRENGGRVLYFWHSFMNKFLTFSSNLFTDLSITDMETCYKLFRNDVIKKIAPRLQENRFGFEPEVTALAARDRCKFCECAIHYYPRSYDEGKKITWKDGVRALICIVKYGDAPLVTRLMFFTLIGLFSILYSVLLFYILKNCNIAIQYAALITCGTSALLDWVLSTLFVYRDVKSSPGRKSVKNFIYLLTLLALGAADYYITLGIFKYLPCSFVLPKLAGSLAVFFCRHPLRTLLLKLIPGTGK